MRSLAALLFASVAAIGCGTSSGDDDAVPDAASQPADAAADAPPPGPDAFDPCPGPDDYVTGDYVDWDSTDTKFKGIAEADVTVVAGPTASDQTSPNGRYELCMDASADFDLALTHADYLPVRFPVDADLAGSVASLRGLTPARADELYTALGLTRDPGLGTVIVDAALIGTQVELDVAHAGAFTPDASGALVAGDILTHGPIVLFANVTGAETALTLTPPGGETCDHRATLAVIAGAITFTQAACQ